jgi:hypothetical protein
MGFDGETLTNDMQYTPFEQVYYMIFRSAKGNLQNLRLFWYKAESSRSAKIELRLLLRQDSPPQVQL